jgi:hypothetical protein
LLDVLSRTRILEQTHARSRPRGDRAQAEPSEEEGSQGGRVNRSIVFFTTAWIVLCIVAAVYFLVCGVNG